MPNNLETIGSGSRNICLRTFGKVYIQVKDRYYELDFKNKNNQNSNAVVNEDSSVIVVNTRNEVDLLEYPGNGKLIVTLDGYLFICNNDTITEFTVTSTRQRLELDELIVNGPVTINTKSNQSPLIINSDKLVKNLNAEFLGGLDSDKYAVKHRNETITGEWAFDGNPLVKNILYIDNVIKSTNKRQTTNETILDFATSTLTIDNINVRKRLTAYEYVINRIKATNGSFWVSDSAEIQSVNVIGTGIYNATLQDSVYKDYTSRYLPNEWHTYEEWLDIFSTNWHEDFNSEVETLQVIDLNNSTQVANANAKLQTFPADLPSGDKEVYQQLTVLDFVDTIYNAFYNTDRVTTTYTGEQRAFTMKDEGTTGLTSFWVNDIVKCQKAEGLDVISIEGVVTYVSGLNICIKFTSDSNPDFIKVGDTFVRIDNTVHPDRMGAIYLTSSDTKSPFIDIIDNTDYHYNQNVLNENTTLTTNSNIKVRLGRLDGLAYDDVFGRMSGIGLFIQGKAINTSSIWAGTDDILTKIKNVANTNDGGIYLKNVGISLGNATNETSKVGIILNPDGSGWLAQGNINWDVNGNANVRGVLTIITPNGDQTIEDYIDSLGKAVNYVTYYSSHDKNSGTTVSNPGEATRPITANDPPLDYKTGDTWYNVPTASIKVAIRDNQTYNYDDWELFTDNSLDFLKNIFEYNSAISNVTKIVGGLVSTSVIRLGGQMTTDGTDTWVEQAGISGVNPTKPNALRAWFGGQLTNDDTTNAPIWFRADGTAQIGRMEVTTDALKFWGADDLTPVLEINSTSNTLKMNGSGTFTGTINATGGTFNNLTATNFNLRTGQVGPFYVTLDNALIATLDGNAPNNSINGFMLRGGSSAQLGWHLYFDENNYIQCFPFGDASGASQSYCLAKTSESDNIPIVGINTASNTISLPFAGAFFGPTYISGGFTRCTRLNGLGGFLRVDWNTVGDIVILSGSGSLIVPILSSYNSVIGGQNTSDLGRIVTFIKSGDNGAVTVDRTLGSSWTFVNQNYEVIEFNLRKGDSLQIAFDFSTRIAYLVGARE